MQTVAPEAPLSDWNGLQLCGFEEPVLHVPEPPSEPAAEDVVALLAEQPEVAPLVDVHMPAIEEVTAVAPPAPEPVPELPPEPEPEPESSASSQNSHETLIARLSSAVAAPQEASAMTWQTRQPARPVVARPDPPPRTPSPQHPIETPPQPFAPSFSAPAAADRIARQPLSRNRRLYRRVQLGAELEIDGVPSNLIDISIGGFAATGVANLAVNMIVPMTLRLIIDGIEVGTQLQARIVYANRERSSGRFIEPTASQTAFLRYMVTWRGESVGTVGTTTLLDAITGGLDHGFSPKSTNGPRERWWYGMVGRKVRPPR